MDTGWQSVVRFRVIPRLPALLMQELKVFTALLLTTLPHVFVENITKLYTGDTYWLLDKLK